MDERRPELQGLLDMVLTEAPPFSDVVVHSFNRFARDHFALEFPVRRRQEERCAPRQHHAGSGRRPDGRMVRQVFALFDECQSKENAKHTLRAVQEHARQGFWNGSKAPYGYAVVAAEQRGARRGKSCRSAQFCSEVARPKGFEPLTSAFGGQRSIQLSYGRIAPCS
jgi:site-specific DNA recombinase